MTDVRRGLIIVNTGPGKGKTTAAMGTALRAVGQGMRVLMLQFLKGSWHYGELDAVQAFGDKFVMKQMGRGFVKVGTEKPDPEDVRMVEEAWAEAMAAINSGTWDLVILDEINYAISYGMLDPAKVVETLKSKPEMVHIILTGRNAHAPIAEGADPVSEVLTDDGRPTTDDSFMAWFKRQAGELDTSGERKVRTEGLWVKCDTCRQIIWKKDLEENFNVCPKCDRHFRIDARSRLAQLLDDNEYEISDANLTSTDPLKFVDLKAYSARLKQAQADTGLKDAVINARGKLNGRTVIVSSMEYAFIGGSMGAVVGEAITRAIEQATENSIPIVIVSASGGARMMEGVISLMQLAKISAALARLDEARVPYISVLTDPTTGGVAASFAMLGDLNIAEPGALIGFAGPRVIEQTIRQTLPDGFQRSEFLLEHGFLDAVVPRAEMKAYIARALDFMVA